MLNLHAIQYQVKFSPTALAPNPANLLGLNECYRQLKAYGWACNETHPTARVSLFRLGGAAIHYDRRTGWQVDVAGGAYTYAHDSDLKKITAEAIKFDLQARCDPAIAKTRPTRKFVDEVLTVAEQKARAAARLGVKADYLNRKAPHRSQFNGIGHR